MHGGIAPDLSNTAFGTLLLIAVLQIWLGLYPKTVLITTKSVMNMLVQPVVASPNPTHQPSVSVSSSTIFTSQVSAP